MSAHTVAAIPGDGIGHEVIPAARRVVDAVADVEFVAAEAGDATRAETGAALPAATREVVADADATLFGAAGETAADVVLPLRSAVGSFVNVRPARAYPGVDALRPNTDLVILRENTEGVYGSDGTRSDGRAELTRVVTAAASERLAEFACDYATDRAGADGPGFTLAHKANVMRETDGLFVERVEAVAAERGVAVEPALMDALATALCTDPEAHDVIVTPNLAGDVLSDLAAGLVGGLGLLPSANLGDDDGLFEPVHGSAPDIAGEGVANPTAAILSGAMLLAFLGEDDAADAVRTAVEATLASGPRTPDLRGTATTEQFTDAVVEVL